MEKSTKKLDTTLGELIAAASEVAFEYSDNDSDAYKLAQAALIEILRKASHAGSLDDLVNRRQEKVICTKPAMWGRKTAPTLPKIFSCIVNAGNFKPTSDVLNSGF